MNSQATPPEDALKDLYQLVPRARLSRYQTLSRARMLGGLVFEWAAVFLGIALCERYFSWPLYLVTVLWISGRVLALGLVMHDGVHGLVSRNRFLNDWVTELFAAWPVFISMRSYRVKHLAHHSHLNTDQDPDWVAKSGNPDWEFPMQPRRLLTLLARLTTGLSVFSAYRVMSEKAALPEQQKKKNTGSLTYQLLRAAYYGAILAAFLHFGAGLILVKYWVVPIATVTQVLNRMRRVAEHSGIADRPLELQTRTTLHGFWSRLLLSPKNISYHNEHHLYPGIPYYRLPEIHADLMSSELAQRKLHVTRSYLGVYRELVG